MCRNVFSILIPTISKFLRDNNETKLIIDCLIASCSYYRHYIYRKRSPTFRRNCPQREQTREATAAARHAHIHVPLHSYFTQYDHMKTHWEIMGCTFGYLDITEISWPDATDIRFSLTSFVQFNVQFCSKTCCFIILIHVRVTEPL